MLGGPTNSDFADEESKSSSNGSVAPFLGLLVFPAAPVILGFYMMLRKGRQRLRVIFGTVLLFLVVLYGLWNLIHAGDKFITVWTDLGNFKENWVGVLPALLIGYAALGAVLGFLLAAWEVRTMKTSKYRRQLEGDWMYQFEFRRTPKEMLTRKKNIELLKSGVQIDENRVPLGLDERNGDSIAYRYYKEAARHTLISGMTGSGKSLFSMLPMVRGDIENQVPTFFIDFKRDPELASKLSTWTHEMGGEFYHFVNGKLQEYDIPHGRPCRYDPLAAGGPTAKADMVLGMREYDTASAVYKANMTQLLQVLFSMLDQADRSKAPNITWNEGVMFQVASAIKGPNLTDLAIACEGTPVQIQAEEIMEAAKNRSSGIRHAMEELAGQIRTIVASEYGEWMRLREDADDPIIDLYELSQKKGSVVLFSLNSDSEPEFAKYVGSMILADITNVSARRRNAGLENLVQVYVDEFQIVPPTSVTGLLEKSRASAIALTLAQQSFEQIVSSAAANGEAYLGSILDTCGNFIVHAGATEDSAERLSKILGKHWVTSYRASNRNKSFLFSINFSNKRDSVVMTSEEERWVFSPREFLTLTTANADDPKSKATAILLNKTSFDPKHSSTEGAVARRVWLIPNSDFFQRYYKPDRKFANVETTPTTVSPTSAQVEELRQAAFEVMDTEQEDTRAKVSVGEVMAYVDDAFSGVLGDELDADEWVFEETDEEEENDLRTIVTNEQVDEPSALPVPPKKASVGLPIPDFKPNSGGGLPVPTPNKGLPVPQKAEPSRLPLPNLDNPRPQGLPMVNQKTERENTTPPQPDRPKKVSTPTAEPPKGPRNKEVEPTPEEQQHMPQVPVKKRRSTFSQMGK